MKLTARRGRPVRVAAIALTAALSMMLVGGTTAAQPRQASEITSIDKDGRTWHLKVYSAAMDKEIDVDIQRPADESTPAPNLYLLNGLDGGLSDASWAAQTDALEFLAGKHVNVVQPIGGYASYYTDWLQPDPVLGVNKWRTFFTEELPPLLDRELGSTGRNALSGLSTSGTSVLQLAEAKPGLFKAVGAYSGCAQIADPLGQQFVKLVVEQRAGGNTVNMYGPPDSPVWAENDPVINAEKLRGTLLYISTGSGIPLLEDVQYYLGTYPGSDGPTSLALGVIIEAIVNGCTTNLKNRLDSLDIPATYQFNPVGTHYWPYWEEALHKSWPLLAEGMGIPA
ncbi:esterase family protein [Nocardia puris]|uniref:S-formylglutathione hydrolase FrmB n=1 Tax=Nocardia puris TaxID=208602 RepID=A0A366DVA9_9NOCA|nr:alpha/beta hydrolase family protein [Nocardia puris]MBF6210580.1 esterase family protein [Nocardia puris]MBF6369305.1 esterase family protein [Nocardia puris]MBF6457840.1 esterase family protein [Nocardia puris]RBO94007.1 S-formylglutathione hydrolase FrmB [Nocardia puris]